MMGTNKDESDDSLFNIPLNSESGSENEFGIGKTHSLQQSSDIKENLPDSKFDYSNQLEINNPLVEDENPEEAAEKARMICQVLELQHTLEDLSQRVDNVKEENFKLKKENQVLGTYIENLMSTSSVFQSTNSKNKKK